jgi:hypothetical protein
MGGAAILDHTTRLREKSRGTDHIQLGQVRWSFVNVRKAFGSFRRVEQIKMSSSMLSAAGAVLLKVKMHNHKSQSIKPWNWYYTAEIMLTKLATPQRQEDIRWHTAVFNRPRSVDLDMLNSQSQKSVLLIGRFFLPSSLLVFVQQ